MITIEQLLESVGLNFEPRCVAKDKNGMIKIFEHKPKKAGYYWLDEHPIYGKAFISFIKLAEFEGKDWTKCIYEIKNKEKPVAKIEKLNLLHDSALLWGKRINELVDAVNELKGAKNE